MRRRPGQLAFLVLAVAGTAFVAFTLAMLPPRVAVHFNLYGDADGWSTRSGYVIVLALMGLVLPLLMLALVARLGASSPELLNVPGRDYWLDPVRREEGLRRIRGHMWWLASLLLLLMIALHALLLAANASGPPRLPTGAFIGLLVGFVAGVVAWVASFTRVLPVPRAPKARGGA